MGLGMIGPDPQGLVETVGGCFELALIRECIPQIEMRVGVIRQ